MAIHPYPVELVEHMQLADGRQLTVRPIRSEDAEIEQAFVRGLSEQSRYFRFMQMLRELTPQLLARFTQIDYDREMALIAVHEDEEGREELVAVARYSVDPDAASCEFALTVGDRWQGLGIGQHLMERLMQVAAARGLERIHGVVLASNTRMLELMQRLGFTITNDPDDFEIKRVWRALPRPQDANC